MNRPLPWEYLSECSETALQNFMISQLNVAAGLRKTIAAESEKLIEALVLTEVSRLLIEKRDELVRMASLRQSLFDFDRRIEPVFPAKEGVERFHERDRLRKSERGYGEGNRVKRSA